LKYLKDLTKKPELSHIVSWGPSGKGFIIHDQPKFEEEVLSKFFNHQKFTSFVRQVRKLLTRISCFLSLIDNLVKHVWILQTA